MMAGQGRNLERIILGTILHYGETFGFREDLTGYDFEDLRNKAVYEAMCYLEDEETPITVENIVQYLKKRFGSDIKALYLKDLPKHKLSKQFLFSEPEKAQKTVRTHCYKHKIQRIQKRYQSNP